MDNKPVDKSQSLFWVILFFIALVLIAIALGLGGVGNLGFATGTFYPIDLGETLYVIPYHWEWRELQYLEPDLTESTYFVIFPPPTITPTETEY